MLGSQGVAWLRHRLFRVALSTSRGLANVIGMVAVGAIAVWCGLGVLAWRVLLSRRIEGAGLRTVLGLAFWSAWLIGPVADELIGKQYFNRACDALPPAEFFGPVRIGAGVFFDNEGRRRWSDEKEFYEIRRATNQWNKLFDWRDERVVLVAFPMQIAQVKTTIYHVESGKPSVASYSIQSQGGWIRRATSQVGVSVGYVCHSGGSWPRDEDRIAF